MKRKHVILIIAAITLVITATVGVTYALWSQTHVQESDNVVTIGCFTTQYSDNAKAINLANTFPITDTEGMNTEAYEFTITNNCSIYATYGVNFEVDATSTLRAQYVKAVLDTKTPQLLNSYGLGNAVTEGNTAYQMITGGLAEGESATYSLRLWLDENAPQEGVENTTLKGKIVVTASASETPPPPEIAEVCMEENFAECLDTYAKNYNVDYLAYDDPDANTRYIGKSPNNYVSFNGESWRIIGSFNVVNPETGLTEKRLKIMNPISLGKKAWNSSGVNEWSTSSLNTELNGTYYSGLTSEAKSLIDKARWNLGGTPNYNTEKTPGFYATERGTTVYSGRSTTHDNYVGLMYPSDYGYATSGGTTGRTTCLAKEIYNWNSSTYQTDCARNSWIFTFFYVEWTLTPYSSYANCVFVLDYDGRVNYGGVGSNTLVVRPVVFLKSDIKITGGTGSSTDAYTLSALV